MNFKIFAIKFAAFILLFFAGDRMIGYIMTYFYDRAGGVYARENYIRNTVNADMLIIGSSRATHHYVPSILSDSLGLSVYNCGKDGNGVIYEYGRLQNIFARYSPKIVILELYPPLDLLKGDNNQFLAYLRPDYGKNEAIDQIFADVDKTEPYKMNLLTYRYNSTIEKIFSNIFLDKNIFRTDGYSPLYASLSKAPANMTMTSNPRLVNGDSLKLYYLNKIIELVKSQSQLIISVSPRLGATNEMEGYDYVKQLCVENNITLISYYADTSFVCDYRLFKDAVHLTDIGAKKYSSAFASVLKEIIIQ